jgi:SAM-dependent methyltransferase
MRGLADIRLLVLVGVQNTSDSESDLGFLSQRTTAHTLPFRQRSLLMTFLRVLKRLALGQDDLILLYEAGTFAVVLIAIVTRFFGRRVVSVSTRPVRRVLGLSKLLEVVEIRIGDRTGPGRGEIMLKGIAKSLGRTWERAQLTPLRIDLGCGSQARPGFTGIDARLTPATAIVSDARSVAVMSHIADEVYASCLLEHFENPHEVLREIHRMLVSDGQAVLRLPNLGTYSSHLDLTHRFLADLALWRRILSGYFEEVDVLPVGTKYRDSHSLVKVNWVLVNLLKWYELAQGWDFVCRRPKATPSIEYVAWWEE